MWHAHAYLVGAGHLEAQQGAQHRVQVGMQPHLGPHDHRHLQKGP
jgi:hypothetical protein